MKDNKKYIVRWKNKRTRNEGHGSPVDYKTAKAWADRMNGEYPHINHWVELEEKSAK